MWQGYLKKRHAVTHHGALQWFNGVNVGNMPVICQKKYKRHHV